ncbi:hypothetical protein N8I74_17390 [Chitiniphilus purpureus]|uniref:DUF1579 domain-containing protein n=1 Tax=Chitiniphilus purpureus TaxID=2981137 RepID=A0ABY6DL30_9NEIS|nr:hypothetical protein [Chitiniphilus sp. CD1]UXY15065.1 hypothetical protein N8I74_17390 [Chitiniphilus sp. CD1]
METSSLAGCWELVSGECLDNGHLLQYGEAQLRARKVLANGYFSFVTHQQGAFWAAGSGRYTVDGQQYTERPDLGTFPPEAMRDYVFRFRLEGDLWHNTRWEDGVQVEYEVWRRVG